MGFDGSSIDGLLEGALASGVVHGVAATVVDRDGVLYEHASGESSADTLYRNASMTKAVATTAALQLVEQGRLDLDATVASICPEFAEIQLLERYDGNTPVLHAPATKPTAEDRAHLLDIRMRQPDGSLAPTELDFPLEPEWEAGGHGSYGTIGDYGRFLRAWLRDGELDGTRILGAETVAMALEDHLGGAPLPEITRSAVPELSNDVPSLPVPQGWGLGFHLYMTDLPGMRSAGSADWAGLFNCYYWLDRRAGVAAVFMTQILPFFDQRVVETLMGFELAVYAQVGAAVPAMS